ncbi:MAG: efflux RND transporter periplasmic adaptor subunit [Pseudomonadota bacterium]
MNPSLASHFKILFLLILSLTIFSCDHKRQVRELPTPEVTISQPIEKEVTDFLELAGNTAALESVEIRARVKGWLESVDFVPGSKVKKGDLLFTIDPRTFKAQVDQYQAQLEGRKAEDILRETNLKRAQELLSTGSISQLKYDEQKADKDVAIAQVGISEANLEKAKLDLDYCRIMAPINGRIGRNLVDVGNLVGASTETLLTQLVNDESIYVYFNLSERDVLTLLSAATPESLKSEKRNTNIPAYLSLSNETGFPHGGFVDFWDPELDSKTGTLQARAIFSNEDGKLMPGMFGRIRIAVKKRKALLVPEIAVGFSQAGSYVMVVNNDSVVEQRMIKTGQLDNAMWVIEHGIQRDDWVIVNGVQRARPGGKVTPQKISNQEKAEPNSGSKNPIAPK